MRTIRRMIVAVGLAVAMAVPVQAQDTGDAIAKSALSVAVDGLCKLSPVAQGVCDLVAPKGLHHLEDEALGKLRDLLVHAHLGERLRHAIENVHVVDHVHQFLNHLLHHHHHGTAAAE